MHSSNRRTHTQKEAKLTYEGAVLLCVFCLASFNQLGCVWTSLFLLLYSCGVTLTRIRGTRFESTITRLWRWPPFKLTVLAEKHSDIKHLFLSCPLWPNSTTLFLKVREGCFGSFHHLAVSSHAWVVSLNLDLTMLMDRDCLQTHSYFGATEEPPFSLCHFEACCLSPAVLPLISALLWQPCSFTSGLLKQP